MKVRELRERVGLSQAAFARLVGVTQPAVSAWERGSREPTGGPAEIIERLRACFRGATRRYPPHRGRTVELPAERWASPVELTGEVELPTRLDWSPRAGPRRLDDREQRAGLYGQVLDEGGPADVRIWVDPDDLVELWPDVPVARHLRVPVADLVTMIAGGPGAPNR